MTGITIISILIAAIAIVVAAKTYLRLRVERKIYNGLKIDAELLGRDKSNLERDNKALMARINELQFDLNAVLSSFESSKRKRDGKGRFIKN
jgi:hypothetical protein